MDSAENIWEEILSREPERIRISYNSLSVKEREIVFDHLRKMAAESGWHKEQKISAESAIKEITKLTE